MDAMKWFVDAIYANEWEPTTTLVLRVSLSERGTCKRRVD